MKITLSWLKAFLTTEASVAEISKTLTAIGLEVEAIHDPAVALNDFIVAQITHAIPHPNADKLRVCTVNTGSETLQIVCGASNACADIFVVLAPVGSVIPTNGMKIKHSAIRGIESQGMLCSAGELGVQGDAQGIIELSCSAGDVGRRYVDVAGLADPVIEIAITPNRGDCLGVYGIARDLAAAGLGTLKPIDIPAIDGAGTSPLAVTIEDTSGCSFLLGRHFTGVRNGPSPAWLAQRLQSIGITPISALVDITNYMTFTYGRPLHVYDASKLHGGVHVRRARTGERIEALNHKSYTLTPEMLIISDDTAPQAIAGIIGGKASGCADDTQNVFLEVAWFDPVTVAQTGRTLDIITDSRYRFERGVDMAFMQDALAIASQLILDICGGTASQEVSAGSQLYTPREVAFEYGAVEALTGMKVAPAECDRILTALGFVKKHTSMLVPSWRSDIGHSHDMVEEIARLVGYDNIPMTPLPYIAHTATIPENKARQSLVRRVLAQTGMTECVTWSFMSDKQATLFGQGAEDVMLVNPISNDLNQLRSSIIPNLLAAMVRNAARGYPDLALFEVGPVYHHAGQGGQEVCAAGIRSGQALPRHVHGQARPVDVFDSKADLLAVLEVCGVSSEALRTVREAPAYYHPGRSGALMLGKTVLAYFGQLHPIVSKAYDVSVPVVGFEVMLDRLPATKNKAASSRKTLLLSDYQRSIRDFAFIVDKDMPAETIIQALKKMDKTRIEYVELFDVYEGKHLEAGKKSIAISLCIRASDHTLSESELTEICTQVIAVVAKHGGVLR